MSNALPVLRKHPELEGKKFLVGIGASKCGTSWLYRYLQSLPEVTVSPLKEVHFFDRKHSKHAIEPIDAMSLKRVEQYLGAKVDLVKQLERNPHFQASIDRLQMMYDDNAYLSHFARISEVTTKTLVDITPAYAVIGESGFREMQHYCNSQNALLNIVFIMRDPVDRLWSQLRHTQQRNPDVDVANEWSDMICDQTIIKRADYRATIEALDEVFPQYQVSYLFYENLFSKETHREICGIADAEFKPADADTRQNETTVKLPISNEIVERFHELLEPQYRFCKQRFGDALPTAWSG